MSAFFYLNCINSINKKVNRPNKFKYTIGKNSFATGYFNSNTFPVFTFLFPYKSE
jgi:hypothetical protein